MATVGFTITPAFTGKVDTTQRYPKEDSAHGCWVIQWTGLGIGDDGEPYYAPDYPDKSVQVEGSDGTGGQLLLEGTNEPNPTNYSPLRDQSGNNIQVMAGTVRTVFPNVHALRPRVIGGDGGTSYTVSLLISTVGRR